ncbi:hypothetical protein [Streptomyces sp. NPDC048643]|uniref:TetR/AcrR family transcriptional regulator n=1 Tax=Streptomyces sp. NPDC048643 TaxID=3155637 RepID=UPI003419FFFF
MPAAVGRSVLADSGHHRAQERPAADASVLSRRVTSTTLRAGIVSSMLVGLVVGRGVVGVATLAAAERAKLIMLVGPAVQSVLVPTPSATDGNGTGS